MITDFWRQMDIISSDLLKKYPLTIIGAGGIGSPTGILFGKMGFCDITIYDHDAIETHNLPNQLYKLDSIGKPKAETLKNDINEYSEAIVEAKNEKYESQPLSGIVISGVDSMAARKAIWNKVKFNMRVPFYIEGRMGAESGMIYSFNPCDPDKIKSYEATLYSDEKSVELPCTRRAIIYNTFFISSLMGRNVKTFLIGKPVPFEILFDLTNLDFFKFY
ncbi:MAG: ThiF family adenylyltransferase [Parcubacteria group bacterium]|nr:ThiF family adenylyltransferase [Parcubacteria group bacterium]